MTFEEQLRREAWRYWGVPDVPAAAGISPHDWRSFTNGGAFRPSTIQLIHLARRMSILVPETLIDQWRAEKAA
jgi:hypothetical protein